MDIQGEEALLVFVVHGDILEDRITGLMEKPFRTADLVIRFYISIFPFLASNAERVTKLRVWALAVRTECFRVNGKLQCMGQQQQRHKNALPRRVDKGGYGAAQWPKAHWDWSG